MKSTLILISLALAMMTNEARLLFDFTQESDISTWVIQDDVVMGGRSDGRFSLSEEGHGVFSGKVSLENNGGFSSVLHKMEPLDVSSFEVCKIRLKGDGKGYQFRVKNDRREPQSYIQYFETSGEWETITIQLSELSPTYRGRQLNMPNYPGEQMEEIRFLIGNKKAQTFRLELDKIWLE